MPKTAVKPESTKRRVSAAAPQKSASPTIQPGGVPDLKKGEVYAGVMLGKNGADNYHLIRLPGDLKSGTWTEAGAWAKKQGGELPLCREQAVMFGQIPDAFEKAYYWSGEQRAAGSVYAWCQFFGYGNQLGWRKDDKIRACAVRRVPIR